MIKIRAAEPTDAGAIAEIWNPIICDTTITFTSHEKNPDVLAEDIKARNVSGQGAYVAEEAGCVVGYATYGPFRDGSGYACTCEHTIILAPHARGCGVGTKLMQTLESHAVRAGISMMIAAISAENHAALQFHARIGFQNPVKLNAVATKFDRILDLVLMQKSLS